MNDRGEFNYVRIIIGLIIVFTSEGSPSKLDSKFWCEYQVVEGEEKQMNRVRKLMLLIETLFIVFAAGTPLLIMKF